MEANNTRYTVLSYNIGAYEIIHPVKEKSPRARYIMVTDDPSLKDESNTWEIVCDETLTGSAFDKVLQVRYNPFKYTDDSIVVKIDGSVGIEKNLDPLVDRFLKDDKELSIMIHPTRRTLFDEYLAWCQTRQYPVGNANAILNFLSQGEGYPVKDVQGLVQLCFQIEKKTRVTQDLNRLTYAFCKYLGDTTSAVERVDQCIYSFVLQKYYANLENKIMYVDQRMYNGQWFTWYAHNSDIPMQVMDVKDMKEPYFFNKRIHNAVRPQDI